jgi:hypothetical protein
MSSLNPFETETMAELCLRQGHHDEGVAIFRRLRARAADEATMRRLDARLGALEGGSSEIDVRGPFAARSSSRGSAMPPSKDDGAPLGTPGLRARATGDALTIDWRLPAATRAPELELLLVLRTPAGVKTETRALRLDAETGRLELEVAGLHSARAAAGFRRDGRFVPLVRAASPP